MNETSTCPVCEERFNHRSTHSTSTHPFCSSQCHVECMGDDEIEIFNWGLESGALPAEDPDRWNQVSNIFPGVPCPDCDMNIRMILGPTGPLEPYARVVMETCPETRGFEHPVYLDCSRCDWHDVDEWKRIRTELEKHMYQMEL